MNNLCVHTEWPSFNATWHWQIPFDPDGIEKLRYEQKMQLARYARQPIAMWDDMEVIEMQRYHAELVKALGVESGVGRTVEDH